MYEYNETIRKRTVDKMKVSFLGLEQWASLRGVLTSAMA